ncbi:MAG TPA: hypothetical protein VKS78_11075 [Roseiarcus sp.]|nr:hypothetical protein [Roseiarcus sp.]
MKTSLRSHISVLALTAVASAALASAAFSQTPRRALVPCNYPHGWNSTDASRELWGVPNGMNHQCVVVYGRDGRLHYEDSAY